MSFARAAPRAVIVSQSSPSGVGLAVGSTVAHPASPSETGLAPASIAAPDPAASGWPEESACGQQFLRQFRLTEAPDFESALHERPVARTRSFALHARPAVGRSWRLGLVIPKRWEVRAVSRVAIKRVWRETFRRQRTTLQKLGRHHDLVVRLCAKPPHGSPSQLKRWCHGEGMALFDQLLHKLEGSRQA